MKLSVYYVVETHARDKDDERIEYVAGPFRSWESAFGYRSGVLSVSPYKDLDVVEQINEVRVC